MSEEKERKGESDMKPETLVQIYGDALKNIIGQLRDGETKGAFQIATSCLRTFPVPDDGPANNSLGTPSPERHPSYEGKLYWDLTDEEHDEFRRDGEALSKLLDDIGILKSPRRP